ncbi:hypothetical protein TSOC_002848 [Tetrabaena socialis]|uniref:Uncharacterized protein n=1 Tax=Tetrabaena socialis TaxID=47790 RepID=A0A2J8AD03_9CHLO|nr:hypothetical protein TSOC_002848 [Tetrabaena socialis]|eukprot:PNH10404.1 hypothetical protein TSOC_002848 [Tetrabaena socialis]
MYGRNDPAANDRRQRGEYVPSAEDVPQPMSFRFDTPIASGLVPGARDFLVEEASGGSAQPQHTGPVSGGSRSGSGTGSGSRGRSQQRYYLTSEAQRRPYGAYNGQGGSPGSSQERLPSSSGTTPRRRSYGPALQQPPFLSGVPGPAREPKPGTTGATGAGRPAPVVPAWAPVAGIENMRLDEMDEGARVALMLNDPSARASSSAAAPPAGQPPRGSPPPPAQAGQPQQVPESYSGSPTQQPGTWNPSGYGETGRCSDVSNSYYPKWRLRKHLEPYGVPAHRFSQPRSQGLHVPLTPSQYSFDEAHPAMAEQHYARSPAQEAVLQTERRKMQQEKMRAARTEARSRTTSPMPTSGQLAADVNRLARVRDAGRARLRQLEEEGETLKMQTRQVQQRALDAISRSAHISTAVGRSRSPSASPPPRRSRSPSPSAFYGYSRPSPSQGSGSGGGGGYFGSPPSLSPGRFRRPASASPAYGAAAAAHHGGGGHYGPLYPAGQQDEEDEEAEVYYDDDGAPVAGYYEQGYDQGADAGFYGRGGPHRPVSAPPGPPAPVSPAPPRPSEAQQILDMIDQADRLPHHEQAGPRGRRGQGAAASPDPLVRASAVAGARKPLGLMDADEQRIAVGAYDRSRYEEYQRQVDLEMQRRAVEGGYDSDRERDQAAALLVRDPQEAAWQDENDWMDESPGYASEGPDAYSRQRHAARRLFNRSTTTTQPFEFEERERARPKSIAQVKLEQDLAIRRQEEEAARATHFRASPVPASVAEPRYERLLLEAEASGGRRGLGSTGSGLQAPLAKPFSFYYRDQDREASRESLARAAKDPARFQERFKALMLEMEARRDTTKRRVGEARKAVQERVQVEAQRSPGSAHAARLALLASTAALAAPSPPPPPPRQEAANSAYKYRLKSVDPAVHSLPHPHKPPGATPDFDTIHRQHELQMAKARAHIRKRITVPQEFTLNGANRDEQTARARKAEERRHRIILDMQVDAELLPEMRWPHKSPRGKVRPTPIPAFLVKYMSQPPGNRSANVRQSSTALAVREGAFMTRAEKETIQRRASEKLRADSLRRADDWLAKAAARKMQEADAARAARGGSYLPSDSNVGATAGGGDPSSNARGAAMRRRAAVSGREDNPEVYVDARHAQIERQVREVVEDTLLDQGIAAYRFVEGVRAGGRSPGQHAGGDGGNE